MAIDTEAIQNHIKGILVALGDDPAREGLAETPLRVARMFEEVFEGMQYSNQDIATMFDKTFEEDLELQSHPEDLVVIRDIDAFSYCEHHLALMYNMKITVAYMQERK